MTEWYSCGNAINPHRCNQQCAAINNARSVDKETAEAWWSENAGRYEETRRGESNDSGESHA